jgi:copper resistance protein C
LPDFAVKTLRVAVLTLLLGPVQALAHAIVVASRPNAHEVVKGPDLAVEIRFNSRIDRGRSKLTLERPDGSSDVLSLQEDKEGDALRSAVSGLVEGSYALSWQTLSVDGHITHGVIPFDVRP